jgi:hypothetical protein
MHSNRLFWGVAFVLLGIVLILNNLGLFGGLNIWEIIGPAFLIALGIWVLVRPYLRMNTAQAVSVPLEMAARGAVKIEHGAGRLNIRSGTAPGVLVEGTCGGGAEVNARRREDRLEVRLSLPGGSIPVFGVGPNGLDWDLGLSSEVPLSLEVNCGASENHLDLSGLRLNELKYSTGASSSVVTMPAAAGMTHAVMSSGAASVEVRVPEGVAARIRSHGGLATTSVDSTRFPHREGFYQSDDYDSAANKLDLDVETGLGSVNIK